jgi:gliding motility-associated-like protein
VWWEWNFGDNSTNQYNQNVYHTYEASPSIYTVSLFVSDDNNCKDTTYRNILIKDEHWIYIPNSFSPDGDQINDNFCISFNGIRSESFNFTVYDRFSNVVYSTSDSSDLDCDNGWNGNYQETESPLLMNTYIYEVNYKDFEGWIHQDFGTIFLIR